MTTGRMLYEYKEARERHETRFFECGAYETLEITNFLNLTIENTELSD